MSEFNYINTNKENYYYTFNPTHGNHPVKSQATLNAAVKSLIQNFKKGSKDSPFEGIKIQQGGISEGGGIFVKSKGKWNVLEEITPQQLNLARLVLKAADTTSVVIERDKLGEEIKARAKEKLYYYSSGGGGHKSAKDAKLEGNLEILMDTIKTQVEVSQSGDAISIEAETNDETHPLDPRLASPEKFIQWCKENGVIEERDTLHDFLGAVGKKASKEWDDAQKAGDVAKQEKLASMQWLSDKIFGPVIFIATLYNLIKHKPKQIISTQAMATPSILFAIQLYNARYKPKDDEDVKLHLYMTDMPTQYASHFFGPLKRLGSEKDFLVLHAPKTQGDFDWQEMCGLDPDPNAGQIVLLDPKDYPVRPAFLKAVKNYRFNPLEPKVQLKVSGKQELKLLQETLAHQGHDTSKIGDLSKPGAQFLDYKMKPEDERMFLMLGSQPTEEAVKGYVDDFIERAKTNPEKNFHLFAYTGRFNEKEACFYKVLCQYIQEQKEWPENLRVLPLSFQDPTQLVSLELHCDTDTRTGGGTVMELIVLSEVEKATQERLAEQGIEYTPRKRYIHAQPANEGKLELSLEEYIGVWEKGNFFFLKDWIGADRVEVVNHRTFNEPIRSAEELFTVLENT